MINVSNEFKEQLNNGNKKYYQYAEVTLKNGTILNLTNKNFWQGGVSVEGAVSTDNKFDIGSAIVNKAVLTINNIYEEFSEYIFEGASVVLQIGMALDETESPVIEKMRKGEFAVNEAKYNGSIIALECLDNMRKFDRKYSESKLKYPATLGQIVRDACSICGVTLQTVEFPHYDYIIQTRPSDEAVTFREILSWCAQIAGCFCRCDNYGRLELKWYNQSALENPEANKEKLHRIVSHYSSPVVSQDDVVITGVRVVEKKSDENSQEVLTTYQSGTDGYVISVEGNELIKDGVGETVVGWLGEQLIGLRFRKAEINHSSDPTIEEGDVAILVDRKGNEYKILISSTTFSTGGSQNTKSSAESPARNSADRFSESTKNYVYWRNDLKKEKTEREKALEELADRLSKSSGVYTTVKTDTDGGKIFYLHNKPKLSESDIVWKMTAEAWAVSTDGGKTWNGGMTVDGDTIVRILTATGVNADWINTGAIQVSDDEGNIIFSVNMDTKQIIISGDSVRIGGKTATAAINDVLQESKDYSDGKLTDFANIVTEDLSSLQAQVDGQIETYYKDYEPSLQNYPANEWTTTEERKKHEGDLFYWRSKGYAYRFFQDDATWKWQLVQDTDITQAMATAERAQDTADGKRRTFVVTPQPPYDIGDLWTNGTDVLTCVVARPQGSVYASSDWQKLNEYTDDTVANEALEEARKSRNLNIILDNEYQGIPADYQGNISEFPTVQTGVQVLYGHEDVSVNCIYAITKSSSITGNWNNTTRIYTVTGLSEDTGWVDITANYLDIFTVTKRFNVQKVKGGAPGEEGQQGEKGDPGRTYIIEPSVNVLKRSHDNSIAPNFIEFKAYYRDGNSATRTAYSGQWIIEETADGNEWTTIYTSSSNESSVTHYLYSMIADSDGSAIANANGDTIGIPRDIIALRAKLYASDGTTNLLDMQSVAVVIDADNLTHEEIFDLLTNKGAVQGIYKEGNQLYINATYIKSGELILGGYNNTYGKFRLLDSNSKHVVNMDNEGLVFRSPPTSTREYPIYLIMKPLNDGSRDCFQILKNKEGEENKIVLGISDYVFRSTYDSNPSGRSNKEFRSGNLSYSGLSLRHSYSNGEGVVTKEYLTYLEPESISTTGTKSRIIQTKDFSDVLEYCYEMPTPFFGDIGFGKLDDNGTSYIFLDEIFGSTINSVCAYYVFLQKEGEGEIWVKEKKQNYFIVKGTPKLKFSWEIKARQKKYEELRLDKFETLEEEEDIDYATQGIETLKKYINNMEA